MGKTNIKIACKDYDDVKAFKEKDRGSITVTLPGIPAITHFLNASDLSRYTQNTQEVED